MTSLFSNLSFSRHSQWKYLTVSRHPGARGERRHLWDHRVHDRWGAQHLEPGLWQIHGKTPKKPGGIFIWMKIGHFNEPVIHQYIYIYSSRFELLSQWLYGIYTIGYIMISCAFPRDILAIYSNRIYSCFNNQGFSATKYGDSTINNRDFTLEFFMPGLERLMSFYEFHLKTFCR